MLLSIAQRVFQTQANAILALTTRLDAAFEQTVQLLADCRGRVIICGIGKSGIIAQKLAATLSSTGTPAFFLHPTDALHGDLGMILPCDCILSISNSGETDEILQLIPHIQRLGLPHVALVGNMESTLARHAQIALYVGVQEESAPLAAVPMASLAATMAMGDALAAALIHLRNFQQHDFARLHPGGNLGRKLVTKVQHAMRAHDLPTVSRQTPVQQIMVRLSEGMLGTVIVTDSHQVILGIITDGDLRRALNRHPNVAFFDLTAEMIMTVHPKVIQPDQTLLEAEQMLQHYKITTLPVANADYVLLGVIAKHFLG